MQIGIRCSLWTGCEDHEGSVSPQFEHGGGSVDNESVSLPLDWQREKRIEASVWPTASGSSSGLRFHGKSNTISRVIDFGGQICEGTLVGRKEHEVWSNPASLYRWWAVVKSDQEVAVDQAVSVVDVKSSLMCELHSVVGSNSVPE